MADGGFPLTGIDPNDPMPGIRRELLFAQSKSGGGGLTRDVVIIANKTSAGSETVDTLGTEVLDSDDCEVRFGRRSEARWMHEKFRAIDKTARLFIIAAAEHGSGTAASFTLTFATAATDTTTCVIDWGGESIEVVVSTGDSVNTIAAAVNTAINAQPYWPFTSSVSTNVVTVTMANLGPRGDLVAARVRARFRKNVSTTVTKSAVTGGTNEDDHTAALAQLASQEIYYQISAKHSTTTVTSTDNGIGEHIEFIRTQALPANGKDQIVFFGLVGSQAEATAVATSTAANSVYAVFFHAESSPWTPGMIAAHCCAAKRSLEIADAGANMTGYTATDNTIFQIPEPYDKTDRPTETEQRADLNNGITPIAFTPSGTPYIVRQITSRSWVGSSAVKDYRAREGHIPSVLHFIWATLRSRYNASKQGRVAADPAAGQKPLVGTTTPGYVRDLILQIIEEFTGGNGTAPLLDDTVKTDMENSIEARLLPDGISAKCSFVAVRHNNKSHWKISEESLSS